jgi:hypothetical protein
VAHAIWRDLPLSGFAGLAQMKAAAMFAATFLRSFSIGRLRFSSRVS